MAYLKKSEAYLSLGLMPVVAFFITLMMFYLTLFSWSWFVVIFSSLIVLGMGIRFKQMALTMLGALILACSIGFYLESIIYLVMDLFPRVTYDHWGILGYFLLGLSVVIYLISIGFYFWKEKQAQYMPAECYYLQGITIWSLMINSAIVWFFLQLTIANLNAPW